MGGIDRQPGGALEETFALDLADIAPELAVRVEDKHLADFRIGDVNVVAGVDRNSDRRYELLLLATIDFVILLIFEVEDVNQLRAWIGDDDPALGVCRDIVGPDHAMQLRRSGNKIEDFRPERLPGLNFLLGGERPQVLE